jgi:squalene synthase HpnC
MLSPGKHYENFPVASLLLPRHMRSHIAAVYAFARAADDFADEGDRTPEQRYRLLDGWGRRLRHAASGSRLPERPVEDGEPDDTIDIFIALGATLRRKSLPVELFEDLLSAFRQDVDVRRYETWEALFDYCRRSANPVGRIVLRIAGYRDGRLDPLSDSICTALQLVNFWQDLAVDFDRGRIYLPLETLARYDALEADLAEGRLTPAWARALGDATRRTRELFERGRPLCDAVGGRLRFELRATWLGGIRILDRIEAARFDVLSRRPTIGLADAPWLLARLAAWRGADAGSAGQERAGHDR